MRESERERGRESERERDKERKREREKIERDSNLPLCPFRQSY